MSRDLNLELDLGPCWFCGEDRKDVRTPVSIQKPAPVPGTGWRCVVYGLPASGAMYAARDRLIAENRKGKWVIKGLAPGEGWPTVEDLKDLPFADDLVKHGAYEGPMALMEWEGDFE